jgi:hypothetical protein
MNTHVMPPKKRVGREPSAADPFHAGEGQATETTQATNNQSHPQIPTKPNPAITKTERPGEPQHQPTTQAEVINISLENAAANWYARLPPRSIMSWALLKEKFLVNLQGFQADITTEEDFFSC